MNKRWFAHGDGPHRTAGDDTADFCHSHKALSLVAAVALFTVFVMPDTFFVLIKAGTFTPAENVRLVCIAAAVLAVRRFLGLSMGISDVTAITANVLVCPPVLYVGMWVSFR